VRTGNPTLRMVELLYIRDHIQHRLKKTIYGKRIVAQQLAMIGFLYEKNSNPTSLTIKLLKKKKKST
jgi:hypothetical protein